MLQLKFDTQMAKSRMESMHFSEIKFIILINTNYTKLYMLSYYYETNYPAPVGKG